MKPILPKPLFSQPSAYFNEIWPQMTIRKTSVMVLKAFFDTILEEIVRVMEEFHEK